MDNLLQFGKGGRGKPSESEKALFMSAVVFSYAVWENYVEQLAVELTRRMTAEIDPQRVPFEVHADFTKNRSVWEVAVSPGWQQLWIDRVTTQALGDEGDTFGLNTAGRTQVTRLFKGVGIDPFVKVTKAVAEELDQLIVLRGEIVHTANYPTGFRKADATKWRTYVEGLCRTVDEGAREECKKLLS